MRWMGWMEECLAAILISSSLVFFFVPISETEIEIDEGGGSKKVHPYTMRTGNGNLKRRDLDTPVVS